MSVEVIAELVQKNGADFGIFRETNFIGGWRTVANVDALASIPASRAVVGMGARAVDTGKVWFLDSAIDMTTWTSALRLDTMTVDALLQFTAPNGTAYRLFRPLNPETIGGGVRMAVDADAIILKNFGQLRNEAWNSISPYTPEGSVLSSSGGIALVTKTGRPSPGPGEIWFKKYDQLDPSTDTKTGWEEIPVPRLIRNTSVNPVTLLREKHVRFANAYAAAPLTVNLYASPYAGDVVQVKDAANIAATYNLTISGNGKTIDGAASYVISTNRGRVTLVFDGVEWGVWS